MKVSVNSGSDVISSLQYLIDYLKDNVGECCTIGKKGLELYFNLQSADGTPSPLNDKNLFIDKEGKVIDLHESMMTRATRYCKEAMQEAINHSLEMYDYANERFASAEAAYNDAVRRGADERQLERLQSSVKAAKFHSMIYTKGRDRALAVKRCIDEGKVSWSFDITMFKKDPYEIKELAVLPTIDKDCTILENPLYYFPGGFWDDKKPVESWFKLTTASK